MLSSIILFTVLFSIYMLPAIIAGMRNMRSYGGIVVLTLFTGWTGIGWVIALIWAVSGETQKEYELKYNR